jgi:hypothetical protein
VCTRRIQCNGETICNSSGWSWWVGRRGLVLQWPNRRPRKEPRSLSSLAMRTEFRRPLSVSVAKQVHLLLGGTVAHRSFSNRAVPLMADHSI